MVRAAELGARCPWVGPHPTVRIRDLGGGGVCLAVVIWRGGRSTRLAGEGVEVVGHRHRDRDGAGEHGDPPGG